MRRTDSQPSAAPADLRCCLFLLPLAPEACVSARQRVREVLTVWRLPDLVEIETGKAVWCEVDQHEHPPFARSRSVAERRGSHE